MNSLKTTLLLTALTVMFMVFGHILAGQGGMLIALVFAAGLNFGLYWYSDKIVLARYGAREIGEQDAPSLHRVVNNLSEKANIPKPKVYRIPNNSPNAFATGRNPAHAAVAVTDGLLEIMDEEELEGVLAHEISHIINRDTLISVIAATLAGAIAFLATMARWGALLGGGSGGRRNNIFVVLIMSIVAPLAATVIQLAISRSREFKADQWAAKLTGRPLALASALKRLEHSVARRPMQSGSPQTAHLFIVNPFSAQKIASLFSTHPSVEDRVKALEKMVGRQ
ncbi:MAG: zinc metalloprotease HtpX [bacterium]